MKAIRSVSTTDTTLDSLETSGAIFRLMPFIESAHSEIQTQVFMTMHSMCRLKASRQEALAAAGMVPHVQRIIREGGGLRQFALQMIKAFALCSAKTRLELKKHGGLDFFLQLLQQKELSYFHVEALASIATWMTEDLRRVEFVLIQNHHFQRLLQALERCSLSVFVECLPSLIKIVTVSSRLSRLLADNSNFVTKLMSVASSESPFVRKRMLQIIKAWVEQHPHRAQFVAQYNLVDLLQSMADNDASLLVIDLANDILALIA
eukprot:TRINITY_DN1497_c0_g1_i2.p1 TRINITY_DN1497_c0_g1~~TRINITY_DN1497_c0_g1_i2.p1  ORF type:complete len:263 (-),score=105.53 TRINITY_DN1497_c0_g1_i2:171-959(-)